jgi:hypothetical protein
MRIKVLITRLCYFFNIVSRKVIGHKELDDLKAYMIETMWMFEMCFPPSFFDMQEHLMIHLVDHIITLGQLYLHSIFSYEQFLCGSCLPGVFYYGRLYNRRSGRMLRGLRKRWKTDRLAYTTT